MTDKSGRYMSFGVIEPVYIPVLARSMSIKKKGIVGKIFFCFLPPVSYHIKVSKSMHVRAS